MPFMVVFRTNEGKAGYHPAETLDDAVRFVEHLRNNQQVEESKVYRLDEVPIEFKVMYKVEVSGAASPTADDSGANEAVRAAETAGASVPPPPSANNAAAPDRAEPLRAATGPGPSAAAPSPVARSSTPSPVAQTGGRFGLFSRT